jgi:hypothetical protein
VDEEKLEPNVEPILEPDKELHAFNKLAHKVARAALEEAKAGQLNPWSTCALLLEEYAVAVREMEMDA